MDCPFQKHYEAISESLAKWLGGRHNHRQKHGGGGHSLYHIIRSLLSKVSFCGF